MGRKGSRRPSAPSSRSWPRRAAPATSLSVSSEIARRCGGCWIPPRGAPRLAPMGRSRRPPRRGPRRRRRGLSVMRGRPREGGSDTTYPRRDSSPEPRPGAGRPPRGVPPSLSHHAGPVAASTRPTNRPRRNG